MGTHKKLLVYILFIVLGALAAILLDFLGIGKFLIVIASLIILIASIINFRLGILLFVFSIPLSFVLGGIAFSGFTLTPYKVLGVVIFIGWLYNLFTEKIRFKFDTLGFVMLLFLAASAISLFLSSNVSVALEYLSSIFLFFILYLILMSSVESVGFIKKIIGSLIISGVFSALIGLAQYLSFSNFGMRIVMADELVRVAGLIGDPNEFGIFLICLLPFIFFNYFTAESKIKKSLFAASFIIILISMLLTFSRTVLLMFFVITPLLLIKKAKSKGFIILFIGTLLILLLMMPSFVNRFNKVSIDSGISIRGYLISSSLDVFRDYPIFGAGLGTIRNNNYMQLVTHNSYVQIAAEIGIIGLLLFIAIIFISFRNLYKVKKSINKNNADKNILLIAESLQLALVVYLGVMLFFSFHYAKLFWIFIILTSVLINIKDERHEKK